MKKCRAALLAFMIIGVAGISTGSLSSDSLESSASNAQSFFDEAFKAPIFDGFPLAPVKGQPMLLMFFEPGCSWCLKQSKVLNLLGSCEKQFSIAGVGINGNRWALKKMGWQLKAKYPFYQATKAFLLFMPPINATPTLFWVDGKGNIGGQHVGFIPLSALVKQLSSLTSLKCAELSG